MNLPIHIKITDNFQNNNTKYKKSDKTPTPQKEGVRGGEHCITEFMNSTRNGN